jgi:hypothetical protein
VRPEALVDPEREPRLLYCLRQNLVDSLTKAGRFEEAKPLLPGLWDAARAHGSRLDHVRVRWVEARITAGLGDRETGRLGLLEVRHELLDRGILFDAALAGLELAALYIEEGKTSEVKELAGEMVAVFRAQNVAREALAALLTFQTAAAMEAATVSLAREILRALERHWASSRPPT